MQRFDTENLPLDVLVADFYEGRVRPHDAPLSPNATFHCDQFHCQMTVGTCIRRQLAGNRAGKPVHPPCGRADNGYINPDTGVSPCQQGTEHFVQLGGWRPPPYSAVPHKWDTLRDIRHTLNGKPTR